MTAFEPHASVAWMPSWPRGQGELQARELFGRTFGAEPDGVWSAPGRVIIIGEHLDYNAGRTMSAATPHRTFLAARPRSDSRIRIVFDQATALPGTDGVWEGDLDDLAPEGLSGWHAYATGTLWALRERGYDGPGLDMAAATCIPVGAGLSGWGAMEAVTVLAADALWGLSLGGTEAGRLELAEVAYEAQNRYIGTPFGGLDQHTSLRCRDGEAITLSFAELPPPATRYALPFREYGLTLLITRTAHHSPLVDDQFIMRSRECAAAARLLGVDFVGRMAEESDALERVDGIEDGDLRRRARHIVTELRRVRAMEAELASTAPAHDRFTEIGRLMYRSHASLELDFEVSSPAQNRAVDAAYRAGALGSRMFGAGLGGSTITLVRRTDAERTAHRIREALHEAGDADPEFLLV
ncbi:galactokinase family protein [Demequina sp. NBRC 110055]|uniref:galactokinase n=1 Tax=Demequina sp. NBRC 110055 TaxID=1570344 RepID=UPI00135657E1|nr:galactokinase family protein [Demequina sp. NBRC 110055]